LNSTFLEDELSTSFLLFFFFLIAFPTLLVSINVGLFGMLLSSSSSSSAYDYKPAKLIFFPGIKVCGI
jgi:hypothetical protein